MELSVDGSVRPSARFPNHAMRVGKRFGKSLSKVSSRTYLLEKFWVHISPLKKTYKKHCQESKDFRPIDHYYSYLNFGVALWSIFFLFYLFLNKYQQYEEYPV